MAPFFMDGVQLPQGYRATSKRQFTQEWCNCEKCKKIPTSLECVCCHEIPAVKAFHLKGEARLFWYKAVLELFCNTCDHF